MIPNPLPRRCLRDQIRDGLLARILDGRYPPGYRLIELALATEFAVSQSPVREALRELEAMGLVHSQRYRGTRVRIANPSEMREAYELRAIIEQCCAEQVVPCGADLLQQLSDDWTGMAHWANVRDVVRYSQHALAFHRRLVVDAGNQLFVEVWDNAQARAPLALVAQSLVAQLPDFVAAHIPILDYLRRGEGRAAGQLLRAFMTHLVTCLSSLPEVDTAR